MNERAGRLATEGRAVRGAAGISPHLFFGMLLDDRGHSDAGSAPTPKWVSPRRQLCKSIEGEGLVEDDVHPGWVVLTDLGLSRALARAESTRGGTPAYMAPERASGTATRCELWPREDIYSLAVMAFELLAGRLPFDAPDIHEVLRLQAVATPPRASAFEPRLPWRVDHTLLSALDKRPERRPSSATSLVEQFERALSCSRGPKILVVDDDGDLARLLSMRLAKRLPTSSLRTVTCGRTAYELLARERPDALITDVEMPGMNGLELLASLRNDARFTTLPRVVVSGRASPADFAIFNELGAAACFAKPVDADSLAGFLRETLHLPHPARRTSGLMRRLDGQAATQPDVVGAADRGSKPPGATGRISPTTRNRRAERRRLVVKPRDASRRRCGASRSSTRTSWRRWNTSVPRPRRERGACPIAKSRPDRRACSQALRGGRKALAGALLEGADYPA